MVEVATDVSAEEKARIESEARRQKILSKANNRLDTISGVSSTPGDEAAEDEEKTSSSSKAAKLAAMRRRRFKKGAAKKEEEGEETTSAADVPAAAVEKKVEAVVAEKVVEPVESTAVKEATESEAGGDDAPKKKYMGVAKKRRQMIKERQAKEEEDGTFGGVVVEENVAAAAARKGKKVATLPILMHMVTVLLLFVAGLDIGLQQSRIEYNVADLTIHTTLAPQQGLRLLDTVTNLVSGTSSKSSSKPETNLDAVVDDPAAYEAAEPEDEFHDAVEDDDEKTENIDPLFQVDLDKYTQGSGIIMILGRFAVACHRLNLYFFYYFPISIVQRMQSMLQSLIESPPMLCLVALVIRQLIGKIILGADLPAAVEDETQGKDVMSMVKNFVKSFILKAFPTAANLYDAWVHLRADMYVMLCGLFVGIAWHHQFATHGQDEPVVVEPVKESPGLSDEL